MKQQYKTVLTYFFTYFFNAGISFFVLSVITHHLTAKEFGIVNLYAATLVLLIPFVSCGTLNTISVESIRKTEDEFKTIFSDSLAVAILNTIVFSIIAIVFTRFITARLEVTSYFIWLLPFLTLLIFFNEAVLTIIRNRNKPQLFLWFSMVKTVAESGTTLVCILLLHMTWEGRISGMFAGVLIAGLISVWFLAKWKFKLNFSGWDSKKAVILLSAPFIIERLSVFILASSDKYFIDHFSGTEDVGLYSLGTQIATIVNLMILSLNNYFYPHIFQRLKIQQDDNGFSARRALMFYVGACFGVIALMLLFIPIIFRFFIGEEFSGALYYAYLLTLSFVPWVFYQVLLIVLYYMQLNKYIMKTALVGMVMSLISNFFLVQYIGTSGAAYTMIVVYLTMAFMLFQKVHQQNKIVLPFFYKSSSRGT